MRLSSCSRTYTPTTTLKSRTQHTFNPARHLCRCPAGAFTSPAAAPPTTPRHKNSKLKVLQNLLCPLTCLLFVDNESNHSDHSKNTQSKNHVDDHEEGISFRSKKNKSEPEQMKQDKDHQSKQITALIIDNKSVTICFTCCSYLNIFTVSVLIYPHLTLMSLCLLPTELLRINISFLI